jgi:deoxycytidylate deaminase
VKRRVAATVLALTSLVALWGCNGDVPTIPSCYEDEAVVGQGQFEHGYWTQYVCIPLDNLAQGE